MLAFQPGTPAETLYKVIGNRGESVSAFVPQDTEIVFKSSQNIFPLGELYLSEEDANDSVPTSNRLVEYKWKQKCTMLLSFGLSVN